jgi:hypothetical protein
MVDRNGECGSLDGCHQTLIANRISWSMATAHLEKQLASLLAFNRGLPAAALDQADRKPLKTGFAAYLTADVPARKTASSLSPSQINAFDLLCYPPAK